MKLPSIEGLIRRRILVNFRIQPEVVRPWLPEPFEPETVNGFAIGGICLIRLERIRPRPVPSKVGLASDNVAYRVAVRWESPGGPRSGVFINRRDTSSALQQRLGGRIFPGEYRRSVLEVVDDGDRVAVDCGSGDGMGDIRLVCHEVDRFPTSSVFESLEQASAFFEQRSVGYSPVSDESHFDGLRLSTNAWRVRPLQVDFIESAFFNDRRRFPSGSVTLDNALIMRDISHEWHALPPLRPTARATEPAGCFDVNVWSPD